MRNKTVAITNEKSVHSNFGYKNTLISVLCVSIYYSSKQSSRTGNPPNGGPKLTRAVMILHLANPLPIAYVTTVCVMVMVRVRVPNPNRNSNRQTTAM